MKDAKLDTLIRREVKRQQETLDLIPSENHPSLEVMRICGSPLMNKYSEGYPGKRYYPGNAICDQVENLAKERALAAFGLPADEWGVNVQAYSGSPANAAVYVGLLNLGDTVMGMSLAAGGHLTHGHKVSFTGIAYESQQYGVDKKTGLLDYAALARLAAEKKPRLLISGTTAYPRTLDFARFGRIAKSCGAFHMADISHVAGLVAAGAYPSPFPYADVVTMTTHKTLRGPRGAIIFSRKKKIPGRDSLISDAIDRAIFPGLQGGPHNQTTAAIAQMFFEVSRASFKAYGKKIVKNAAAMADELRTLGVPLTTGGTDTHLMVIDVRPFGIDGMTGEQRLEKNGLVANRNSLPTDEKPFRPYGIRLGTPAITTRGLSEKECRHVARLLHAVLSKDANVRKSVAALCKKHPLPYIW